MGIHIKMFSAFGAFITIFLLAGCGGKSEVVSVLPPKEIAWNQEEYHSLQEKWNSIETDTSLSDENISLIKKLFFLSVDGRNSSIDYNQSLKYAQILMKYSEESSTSFHNWVMVLNSLNAKSIQINTLTVVLDSAQSDITAYLDSLESVNNTLQIKNSEINTLKEQVASQTEVIEKLKKLEMLMDKERKRFQ